MKLLLKQKKFILKIISNTTPPFFPVIPVLVEPVGIRNIETYHLCFQES